MKIKLWGFEFSVEDEVLYWVLGLTLIVLIGYGIGGIVEFAAESTLKCLSAHTVLECETAGF